MLIGKVSENILKRSVLRQIKQIKDEIVTGAGLGEDCAVFVSENSVLVSSDAVTYSKKYTGEHIIYRVVNDLAAAGGEPAYVTLNILLPENADESELKRLMKQISETAEQCNVQIIGGHTQVTNAVNRAIVTATGIGKRNNSHELRATEVKPGDDIIVTKYIGIEGTVLLAREYTDQLKEKLPRTLIDNAESMKEMLSIIPEAAVAVLSDIKSMHDLSEGGIFGGLWELAQRENIGLKVNMKSIPVKQETIEICEFFGLNPYQLLSSGSLLVITSDGKNLVNRLQEQNIPAAIIGKVTDNNDRIVINEDEVRFLDLPKPDEIFHII